MCLCLLVLCGRKKRLSMPPAEYVCTEALNGEQVGRCRDEGWRGEGKRLPIIERVH